jgi:hypothetical protein
MTEETAKLLSHIPNSGIIQLPGRRFPGIVMQGDSLFGLLKSLHYLLGKFKELKDEENYYETLMVAESLYGQLVHYEDTLIKQGMTLPYTGSVRELSVKDDYE